MDGELAVLAGGSDMRVSMLEIEDSKDLLIARQGVSQHGIISLERQAVAGLMAPGDVRHVLWSICGTENVCVDKCGCVLKNSQRPPGTAEGGAGAWASLWIARWLSCFTAATLGCCQPY
jgi:hypothetical protein